MVCCSEIVAKAFSITSLDLRFIYFKSMGRGLAESRAGLAPGPYLTVASFIGMFVIRVLHVLFRARYKHTCDLLIIDVTRFFCPFSHCQ